MSTHRGPTPVRRRVVGYGTAITVGQQHAQLAAVAAHAAATGSSFLPACDWYCDLGHDPTHRPQLAKLLERLTPASDLVVTSLSTLGGDPLELCLLGADLDRVGVRLVRLDAAAAENGPAADVIADAVGLVWG